MHLAAHGIDAVFLVIAAILFVFGAVIALFFVNPRVMKVIYTCLLIGLCLVALAELLTG
jgi:Sec-independent protein secretion pathway component TatC